MTIDREKLKRMHDVMQQNGYTQDYATFEKKFVGNDNYANRKKVYDLFSQNGADVGKSYEEFIARLQAKPTAAPKKPAAKQPNSTNTPRKHLTVEEMKRQTLQELANGTLSKPQQTAKPKNQSQGTPDYMKQWNLLHKRDGQMTPSERAQASNIRGRMQNAARQAYQQGQKQKKANPIANSRISTQQPMKAVNPQPYTNTSLDVYETMHSLSTPEAQRERAIQQHKDDATNLAGFEVNDNKFTHNDGSFGSITPQIDSLIEPSMKEADDLSWKQYQEQLGKAGYDGYLRDKAWKDLQDSRIKNRQEILAKNLGAKLQEIYSQKGFQQHIIESADKLNMGIEEYVDKYVTPQIMNRAQNILNIKNIEEIMPKSSVEYVVRSLSDSILGTLSASQDKSLSERMRDQQAMAIAGGFEEMPTVKGYKGEQTYRAGLGTRFLSTAANMAMDSPILGLTGGGANLGVDLGKQILTRGLAKVGLVKAGAKLTAQQLGFKVANMTMAQKIGSGLLEGSARGALSLGGYSGITAALGQASTGDDTSLSAVAQAGWEGAKHGAVTGSMFGATGAVMAPWIQKFGINGTETTRGQRWLHGAQKAGATALGLGVEAGTMMIADNVTGDKEISVGQWLEDVVMVGAFKAGEPSNYGKIGQALYGLTHKTSNTFRFGKDSDGNWRQVDIRLTDSEKNELMNSTSGKSLMDAFGKVDKSNLNSKDNIDKSITKLAYQEFMNDPNVSQSTKEKVNAAMGLFNTTRKRSYRSVNDVQNKEVLEYAQDGTLLTRTSYKNAEERRNILFRQKAYRDNEDLLSLVGYAKMKDSRYLDKDGRITDNAVAFLQAHGYDLSKEATDPENARIISDMQNENSELRYLWNENRSLTGIFASDYAKDAIEILKKDPMRRTDEEVLMLRQFKTELDAYCFPENEAHPEQAQTQGRSIAEEEGLGTDTPNPTPVVTELQNLSAAEDALQELMDSNDVFKETYEALKKQGLTNPQIYDAMIQQNGLTEEQLEPFARYLNANARVQGMQEATQEAIEQRVESVAGDWGFHGTMDGQQADGSQMLYVKDNNGRTLIVGSGDVAYDPTTGRPKEGVGDMLVCLDAQTREPVYVKVKDTTLDQTQSVEDFKNEERQRLQMINSAPYNQAAQEQAMKDAAKPQPKEEDDSVKKLAEVNTKYLNEEKAQLEDEEMKLQGQMSMYGEDADAKKRLEEIKKRKKSIDEELSYYSQYLDSQKQEQPKQANKDYRDKIADLGIMSVDESPAGMITNNPKNGKSGALTKAQEMLIEKKVGRVLDNPNSDISNLHDAIVFEMNTGDRSSANATTLDSIYKVFTAFKEGKLSKNDVLNFIKEQFYGESDNNLRVALEAKRKGENVILNGSKGTENNQNSQENSELYRVSESLQGKIGSSLSEEEAKGLTSEMESRAVLPRQIELTPDNWYSEFGEDGKVNTPIGEVKMGENQIAKLFERKRSKEFGMIKPTLEDPDAIIEVESSAADGNEERSSSYLFVKTFLGKNGEKVYYFKSVTVKKDGMEISISSHYDRAKRVMEELEKGKLLYLKRGGAQTEQNQPSVSGATSEEVNAGSSARKDTNNSSNGNENNTSLTFEDGSPVPMVKDSKGRLTPDYGNMKPEQAAEVLTKQFGESAEKVADGQIKKAEKAVKDAEKMKVNYEGEFNDILEQDELKRKTVSEAQKQLEHAQAIKKAMTAKKVADTVKKSEEEKPTEGANQAGSVAAQKFQGAPRLVGNKRSRTLPNNEKIKGHYEIVPAESLTPSNDATNGYKKSDGFPVDAEGRTTNDRDYENDKAAQQGTDQIALKYNGQAIEQVPVVSDEGIVYDGNGRTMAGQKAAKEGTDGEYISELLDNAENFGFTREQIEKSGIEHPRLVLVTDERMPYTTETFAKFNRNEKKAQNNTEQAVAKSKTLSPEDVGAIVSEIEGNGSLEAFFNNPNAISSLWKTLQEKGIIGQNEVAGLQDMPGVPNAQGKEFVKNLVLGAMFKPETIRMMGIDGTIKNKVINGIRAIMDNSKLGDYSLSYEIDGAIRLLYEARTNKMSVDDLLRSSDFVQGNARDRYSQISQALAQALEGKTTIFRELMSEYNDVAKNHNTGEGVLSFAEALGKDELVKEFLKTSETIKQNNIKLYGEEGRNSEQKDVDVPTGNEERPKEAGRGTGEETTAESAESQQRVAYFKSILNRYANRMSLSKDEVAKLIDFIKDGYGYVKDAFDIWQNAKENRVSMLRSDPNYLKESREIRGKEKDFETSVDRMLNDLEGGLIGSYRKDAIEAIKIALGRNRMLESEEKSEPITIATEHGGEKTFSSEQVDLAKKIISENPEKPITHLQRQMKIGYEAATALAKALGWQEKPTFMPKEQKPTNPIEKAAEDYKKEHPLTDEEVSSTTVFDDLPEDQKQYCIDAALDYLHGEDTSAIAEAYYRNIYEKRGENVPQSGEKNTTSAKKDTTRTTDPMEALKKAASEHSEPKAEVKAEPKVQTRKQLEAERDAADNEFDAFMKELRKKRMGQANSGFIDQNLIEAAPKMFSLAAKCAYSRIKLGMYDAKEVVKDLQKRFKEAFDGFDKKDVNLFYSQIMNQKWRDGDKRMSLNDWAEYYKKLSPEHQEKLVGDSKTAEERKQKENSFINKIQTVLAMGEFKSGIVGLRKIAAGCGLEDVKDTDLQELVETAVVGLARQYASSKAMSDELKFAKIKELYNRQPSLNQRDSDRVEKQQYSTPAPYAFLADMYVKGGGKEVKSALEPSAGNGMLTIGLPMDKVHVNDIDEARLLNLHRQGFKNITSQDGTQPFADKAADVVVTNPPFGTATPKEYDGYKISSLEGQMAINALESMKDDGRAAIIIGGKTEYAKNGSLNPKDKAFLGYLYSHYNVEDVINVDGSLYAKQGTTYPTRIILINGRRLDENSFPPVKDKARAETVKDYDELYKRINDDILDKQAQGNQHNGVQRQERRESDKASSSTNDSTPNNEGVRTVRDGGSTEKSSSIPGGHGANNAGDIALEERGRTNDDTSGVHSGGNNVDELGGVDKPRRRRPDGGNDGGQSAGGLRRGNEPERVDVRQRATRKGLKTEKVKYGSKSHAPFSINAVTPADQAEAVQKNLDKLGDVDQLLVDELGYNDKDDLYQYLSSEQIDSVALAINQMKQGNAFIIGDQTGIGKGRQGAALIRYAKQAGGVPIYLTQDAALLSTVYRDMVDIGSKDMVPFVIASNKDEGKITDPKTGEVIYNLPSSAEQKRVFDYIKKYGKLPKGYDYILTTYSQFNQGTTDYKDGKRVPLKLKNGKSADTPAKRKGQERRDAIEALMGNGYILMDECHNASGDSGIGHYFQHLVRKAKGVTFISATYAKRPDSMPIYALRTAMGKAGMKPSELIEAVQRGGTTLQEIMSRALTESGQMVRRERDMTGVTIDYVPMDEEGSVEEQKAKYDGIIGIFNDIIDFQRTFVDTYIDKRNGDLADVQGTVTNKKGTKDFGIKNAPFASKTFNTVRQLLLSIKAPQAVKKAIECLEYVDEQSGIKGIKPVIFVENTMESNYAGDFELGVDMEAPDFGTVLKKGLEGVLRYTQTDAKGGKTSGYLKLSDLGEGAEEKYNAIVQNINSVNSGMFISPIDYIKHELESRGYRVGELTGRKIEFVYNDDGTVKMQTRISPNKKEIARKFNNGEIDVIIANKSGATGIDLHAGSKFKDNRQRREIILQNQLDINGEVQAHGRVDRTNQEHRGQYEYILSMIPAEQRLFMMLKSKLKSLYANTTSSQKSKFNDMEVADIINKYGDKVVAGYLSENLDIYSKLSDPLGWEKAFGDDLSSIGQDKLIATKASGDAGSGASKVLQRMALLKVAEQEKVIKEISDLYANEINRLNEMGENDLEITELPLKAKTIGKEVWKEGSEPNGDNAFADNTYIEKVNMAILKKPMKAEEVKKAQEGLTGGRSWDEYKEEKKTALKEYFVKKFNDEKVRLDERAKKLAQKAADKYNKEAKKNQDKNQLTDEQIEKNTQFQYDNVYKGEKAKADTALKNIKTKYQAFDRVLETFNTNEAYVLPTDMNNPNEMSAFGNSYGRLIDIKITDNYSPTASTISFATLDGRRKITFPIHGLVGSGDKKVDVISTIYRLTKQAEAMSDNNYRVVNMSIDNWDRMISNESRKDGYIITGNLMQALIDTKAQGLGGQLVKYTTDNGEVKTGILMPDRFKPTDAATEKTISSKADDFMSGKTTDIVSSDGEVQLISVSNWKGTTIELRVPKSKAKGGKYYLDEKLRSLADGNDFYTKGGSMVANVQPENVRGVLDRLSSLGVKVREERKEGTHFRMELGKTFSDTKENFDGVRDRAVEEKGIVMPNLNKESVNVVPVEKHSFGENINKSLENAKKWAKENVATSGKDLPTMRDGTPYTISKAAIDKYLSKSATSKSENLGIHLSVLSKLTDVIRESIEAEIHPDYKKGEDGTRSSENGYGDNVLIHRLYGAVELDGKMYRVKTTMQEFRGGEENKPHSYEVTKIELLEGSEKANESDSLPLNSASNSSKNELSDFSGTAVKPDNSPLSETSDNSISAAKLLNGVEKSYDSGKKLLDESKDLTDGETYFRDVNQSKNASSGGSVVSDHVAKIADKVGGNVNMVNSPEEVTNPAVKERLEKGENVTGWYDEKTGEVHLYMPNIHDRYTAEKTIWHEVVGHKGMRGLFGDKFNDFLRSIYYELDKPENAELKRLVDEERKYNPLNIYDSIEEGIARLAEDGKGEVGFWNTIKNKVTDILHEIGYRIAPNTKDVKYLLWLSKNLQKNPNSAYWKLKANAVRYKLENEKLTTIKNGTYADNDGKVKDYEDFTRKDWEEATDMTVHFRTTPSAATEIEIYNRAVGNVKAMAEEAYSDKMNSILELYKAIDPSIKRAEDVKTSENPYMMENLMSSRAQQVGNAFVRDKMDPLTKAFNNVLGSFSGKDMDDCIRNANLYLVKKSGLERNRAFFVRDSIRKLARNEDTMDDAKQLQADWDAEHKRLKSELDNKQITLKEYFDGLDDFIRKNVDSNYDPNKNDYSGFHEMQNILNNQDIDDALIQDEVMSAESSIGSAKVDKLWNAIKDATDYSLDAEYNGGFQDKYFHQQIKDEMNWYVPMRMFDQETAEDVYGYVDDNGGRTGFIGPVLMKAKGRTSLSNLSILAQIGAMGERAINRSARNAIKQALMRFVINNEKAPVGERLVTEINPWFEKVTVGGVDTWEERFPTIPDDATPLEISQAVEKFENAMKAKEAKGEAKQGMRRGNVKYKFADKNHRPQHIVDVWVNGKKRSYIINGNPRAAQAINGMLDYKGAHNWFSKSNRWLSQVCTSYNPEFTVRNAIRDYGFATNTLLAKEGVAYTLKFEKHYAALGLSPIINTAKGIGNANLGDIKNALAVSLFKQYKDGTLDVTKSKYHKWFKEFMDNGGETGYLQMKNVDAWKKKIDTDIKDMHKSKLRKINPVKTVVGFVEDMNQMAENIARFATFCASRESGRNATRSAYDAKEVSVNFNRSGSAENVKSYKYEGMGEGAERVRNAFGFTSCYLRNYTMFFNASVQSFKGLSRNVKNAPVRTIASMVAVPMSLGLLMPLVNQMLYGLLDDDEKDRNGVKDPYAELPDYIRRYNLCIYAGKGRFIQIPIAIEGRAFYGLGDIAASYTYKKDLKETRSLPLDIANQLAQIVPVGSFMESSSTSSDTKAFLSSLGTTFLPSVASPVLELAFNRDWKGQPIYNDATYMENAPAWKKAYGGTSEVFTWVNKKANAWTNDVDPGNENMKGSTIADALTNPFVWEQLFDSYVGGMGTFATRTAVTIGHALDKDKEVEVKDIPFARSLFYTPSSQTSLQRTKSKWYNYKDEVETTNYNLSQLKRDSKDPLIGLKSATAWFKYTNSSKSGKVNIVNDYDDRIGKLNKILKVTTDNDAIKKIEAEKDKLMQEAVAKLDSLDD